MKINTLVRTGLGTVTALVLAGGWALAAMPAPGKTTASPAPKATLSPHALPSEVAFVRGIQKDLAKRFPTEADAEAAGYFRYTNEDSTGAISFANLKWHSRDPRHPSQLWYDVKGNLLGADFSVPQRISPAPPKLWGVKYQRWLSFPEHIHYILAGPNHTTIYGATSAKKFAKAGGNVEAPAAATLVKMKIAKNLAAVKRVFLFPSIWDLIVWIKPNPNGAFAEHNPNVIPSANAAKSDM